MPEHGERYGAGYYCVPYGTCHAHPDELHDPDEEQRAFEVNTGP